MIPLYFFIAVAASAALYKPSRILSKKIQKTKTCCFLHQNEMLQAFLVALFCLIALCGTVCFLQRKSLYSVYTLAISFHALSEIYRKVRNCSFDVFGSVFVPFYAFEIRTYPLVVTQHETITFLQHLSDTQ